MPRRISEFVRGRLFLIGERPPASRGVGKPPFVGRSGIELGRILDAYYPDLIECQCRYLMQDGQGPWNRQEAWNTYLNVAREAQSQSPAVVLLFGRRCMATLASAPPFFERRQEAGTYFLASMPSPSSRNFMWQEPSIRLRGREFFWGLLQEAFGERV